MEQRNSQKTKQKIIDALGRLIERNGYTAVGVNAVAREAGVDKVLIYRYFGSMEGLLGAFASERKLFPTISDLLDDLPENVPQDVLATRVVTKQAFALLESPLARELIRWELTEQNPLTTAFAEEMERKELNALTERGISPDEDIVSLSLIIMCGLQFLILRSENNNPMLGMDFTKPRVKKNIERLVGTLMKAFLAWEQG